LVLYKGVRVPYNLWSQLFPRRFTMKLLGCALLLTGMAGFVFGPPSPVPEISPDSASTALVLISGALLVMRGRRKK
jgi:hypothetical protein